jgi:hypothetical protein
MVVKDIGLLRTDQAQAVILAYASVHRLDMRGGRLVRYSVSPLLSGFPAGWLRNVLLLGCRAGRA